MEKMTKMPMILFRFLCLTWGLTATCMGFFVTCVCWCLGGRLHRYGLCYRMQIGEDWGGLCLGPFLFVAKNSRPALSRHEHGHAFQNAVLGPFYIFFVLIPSAVRFWHRKRLRERHPEQFFALPAYDTVWFEGQATALGQYFFKHYQIS